VNKITNWIKGHQIVTFFTITFAITWELGFSYGAVMKQGQFLLAPLMFVATCGPALAGIIISAVSNTQPRQGTPKHSGLPSSWHGVCLRLCYSSIVSLSPTLSCLPSWS